MIRSFRTGSKQSKRFEKNKRFEKEPGRVKTAGPQEIQDFRWSKPSLFSAAPSAPRKSRENTILPSACPGFPARNLILSSACLGFRPRSWFYLVLVWDPGPRNL